MENTYNLFEYDLDALYMKQRLLYTKMMYNHLSANKIIKYDIAMDKNIIEMEIMKISLVREFKFRRLKEINYYTQKVTLESSDSDDNRVFYKSLQSCIFSQLSPKKNIENNIGKDDYSTFTKMYNEYRNKYDLLINNLYSARVCMKKIKTLMKEGNIYILKNKTSPLTNIELNLYNNVKNILTLELDSLEGILESCNLNILELFNEIEKCNKEIMVLKHSLSYQKELFKDSIKYVDKL